jgi:Arc/MetJ-type ribon-helix-helix transcriptional regulator
MQPSEQFRVTLTKEMAQLVRAKVASGEYATASDVINDWLSALAAHDAAVDRWLFDEVVPTLEEIRAKPEQLLDADEAWSQLGAHILK